MISFPLGRASAVGVAILLLAGCGAPTTAVPQASSAINENGALSVTSRINQASSGTDLLYVADSSNTVYMFNYPSGTMAGSFSADVAGGLCADTAGDVFVVGRQTLVEYAHCQTSPIATLNPGAYPLACSVDPNSGNVATLNNQEGSVSIFTRGSGAPTQYFASFNIGMTCAYDDAGNLFMGSTSSSQHFALAELPAGGNTIRQLSFSSGFQDDDPLEFDGSNLVILDAVKGKAVKMYQVRVSGSAASIVGSAKLQTAKSKNVFFALDSNRLFMPKSGGLWRSRIIGFWSYPRGGKPLQTVKLPANKKVGGGGSLGLAFSPGR
jgi:hypothetical protein